MQAITTIATPGETAALCHSVGVSRAQQRRPAPPPPRPRPPSVNQAGGDVLGHLQVDLFHAAHSRSMFLTESAFLADLLRLRSGPTLSEDVARFALQLDLPVLAGISVDDLMRVRNEYGEAFHAFRLTLQRHLRDLSCVRCKTLPSSRKNYRTFSTNSKKFR